MNLPENFVFTQQNLQDFSDCRFRFLLKHIRKTEWPAIETEPVMLQEARMELGQQFHRLVQQYFSAMDPNLLASTIQSTELADWWEVFIQMKLVNLPGEKYAEKMLSIPFEEHRMLAKYDLLIDHGSGKFTIYDWKTSQYQPARQKLFQRLQSIVYPFVLYMSLPEPPLDTSKSLNIDMIYWFPTFPETPIQFTYAAEKFSEDKEFLSKLIHQVTLLREEQFEKTSDPKKCNYCRYRSLCDRGISAGTLSPDMESQPDEDLFDLDFDSF